MGNVVSVFKKKTTTDWPTKNQDISAFVSPVSHPTSSAKLHFWIVSVKLKYIFKKKMFFNK